MAYCISDKAGLVGMIRDYLSNLQYQNDKAVALLLPLPQDIVATQQECLEVLSTIISFSSRRPDDGLPDDAVGLISLSKQRTVDDALAEMSPSGGNAMEMLVVMNCIAPKHVPGQTRVVKTPFGLVIVDRQQFAAATGLPLAAADAVFYTAFIFNVDNLRFPGHTTRMLVAVRGVKPTAESLAPQRDELSPLFGSLKQRGGFDTSESVNAGNIADAWQLKAQPRFGELLGWMRYGYGYVVCSTDDGGLEIPY